MSPHLLVSVGCICVSPVLQLLLSTGTAVTVCVSIVTVGAWIASD